jgi:hypothetical protein
LSLTTRVVALDDIVVVNKLLLVNSEEIEKGGWKMARAVVGT